MTQDVICVTMEKRGSKLFCEEVSEVDGGVDSLELKEVLLNPVTDDMIFYVHVSCSRRRLLCHGHRGAGIIVFV